MTQDTSDLSIPRMTLRPPFELAVTVPTWKPKGTCSRVKADERLTAVRQKPAAMTIAAMRAFIFFVSWLFFLGGIGRGIRSREHDLRLTSLLPTTVFTSR